MNRIILGSPQGILVKEGCKFQDINDYLMGQVLNYSYAGLIQQPGEMAEVVNTFIPGDMLEIYKCCLDLSYF